MSASSPPAPATSPVSAAITALRAAGESGDADAVAKLLASDVVFHSPLTTRVRFEGKEEVAALHRDIFAVLEDLHTTEPLALGDTRAFSFHARVRGVELEAINLVRFNDQGQIVEIKIFIRPLPGLATLFATLPPRVSARRRGRLLGALVASLTRPLALVLHTADRLAPRFL
ncbi:nuclear transport factor 2 family protein [Actinomadura rudentiformis]|uniref:Nuclear transport factor 2 family protein n=1 Tax=Actinomadura rudentiformis TaxID=359158 RepID=A0A6H9Z9F4_9ACTN|nr:nuclear transport factor 2 family protein [Actinomadura rudentiformis]KAB2352305.1 nuclear transport factor 2 family protein [Actinomadura rudentiformis]